MATFEFHEEGGRRLPVYVLADCSGSMAGDPIEGVNQGLQLLQRTIQSTPHALETVWLSLITFADAARQVVPLTAAPEIQMPHLTAQGATALGAALRTLLDAIDREVIVNTPERKGDYKPLVFLFTDGQPTDDWREPAAQVKSQVQRQLANVIALGAGAHCDVPTLRAIAETVLFMEDTTPDNIRAYFQWVSQSVRAASIKASAAGAAAAEAQLPPLPDVIKVVL